jgi:hypothetical protein
MSGVWWWLVGDLISDEIISQDQDTHVGGSQQVRATVAVRGQEGRGLRGVDASVHAPQQRRPLPAVSEGGSCQGEGLLACGEEEGAGAPCICLFPSLL